MSVQLPTVAVTVKFETVRVNRGPVTLRERHETARMGPAMANQPLTGNQVVGLVQQVVNANGHGAQLELERRYYDGPLLSVGRRSSVDGDILVVPSLDGSPFFRLSKFSQYVEVLVTSHSWDGSSVPYSQVAVNSVKKFAGELTHAFNEAVRRRHDFPAFIDPQNV